MGKGDKSRLGKNMEKSIGHGGETASGVYNFFKVS